MLLRLIVLATALTFMSSSAFADQCKAGSRVTITGRSKEVMENMGSYSLLPGSTSPCEVFDVVTKIKPPLECYKNGATFSATGELYENYMGFPMLDADNVSCNKFEPADANSGNDSQSPSAQGRWLVIAGAWPKGSERKVKERVALLERNGFSVQVIDSDDYSNLAPGLSAVVLGPVTETTRSDALARLAKIQPIVPDAYIKAGSE